MSAGRGVVRAPEVAELLQRVEGIEQSIAIAMRHIAELEAWMTAMEKKNAPGVTFTP